MKASYTAFFRLAVSIVWLAALTGCGSPTSGVTHTPTTTALPAEANIVQEHFPGAQEIYDPEGHVTHLTVTLLEPGAELPPEIGEFSHLQSLELHAPTLTHLPPELGQLNSLESLELHTPNLTGLPSEIGKLRKLRSLSIWDDAFTTLPPEIGQLTALEALWLRRSALTSLPPEIGQLTSLQSLTIVDAPHLTTLPLEIGRLQQLQTLQVGSGLTSLPPTIGQLSRLATLNLGGNQLTDLPPEFRELRSLNTLDLRWNRLSDLPPEISQLSRLVDINLENNRLAQMPIGVLQFSQVITLNLGANYLAALPPEIGQLTGLTALNLGANHLTSLPPEIGQLRQLTVLNLGANRLTYLPPQIGQLAHLERLDLAGNPLGRLPPEIGQLTRLQSLNLWQTGLSALPPEIGQLTALTELDLGFNPALTELPPELGRLENLTHLNLRHTGVDNAPPGDEQLPTEPIPFPALQTPPGQDLTKLEPIRPDNAARLTAITRLGKGVIYDFAWLPDGRLIAATPLGLYLYDTAALTEALFIPAGNPATALAVSPHGALAAAAQESFIQIWSLADGRPLQNLSEHSDSVLRLAFSPDTLSGTGSHWLASTSRDGMLRLWNLTEGQARYVWSLPPYGQFVFSPDGRWLAMGGGKWNRQVQVYDLTAGQLAAELEISPDLRHMAFSPDSRTLLLLPTGENPTPALLWDFAGGQTRRLVYDQQISSAIFSPDGARLATGSLDGEVRLWNIADGQAQVLGRHPGGLFNLAFSPDGQRLASADKTRLKLWDANTQTLRFDLVLYAADRLVFSPNGRFLALRRGGTLGLVDLADGQLRLLPGHSDLIASLAFAPDGQTLAAGDWSGVIQTWSLTKGQPLLLLDGHTGPVGSLTFSPTELKLASGGINEDHTARLWDVTSGQPLDAFTGDSSYPLANLTFSPDGQTLAGGGLDGVVLRDLTTGATRRLTGHSQPVLGVAFSPDGRLLASGGFDEAVILWDLASGKKVHALPGHVGGAVGLVFSPNGEWLVTGDQQDRIRGWQVETGHLVQTIEGRGQELALSSDGQLLVYKPTLDTVALWDVAAAREVFRGVGQRPLALSPDGGLLAVGSQDGLVTLWGVRRKSG